MRKKEIELMQKYRQGLKELKKELDPQWIKEAPKRYLLAQMIECLEYLIDFYSWYWDATQRGVSYEIKRIMCIFWEYEKWERRLDRLKMEYEIRTHNWRGKGLGITQQMIDRAKEYPIEQIIEVNKRGFALCPNHEDHHPSLDCRNGFCYCYSCHWSGDVISLYMKLHNVDFKEAVKYLSERS